MKQNIYARAASGEIIGNNDLIYSPLTVNAAEIAVLKKNKCYIASKKEINDTIKDLILLGAQPTKADRAELESAKGLLEYDYIKRKILDRADIRINDPKWVKEYEVRIKKL